MNIFMRGDHAVPILIDHTTVYQEPKITRRRRFIGLQAGLKILAAKAIDAVLDSFWETEQEVLDAGKQETVHYAIEVRDEPGAGQPELVVSRLDGQGRPGCGLYFNIIKAEKSAAPQATPPSQAESKAKLVNPKTPRPNGSQAPASILSRIANPDGGTAP